MRRLILLPLLVVSLAGCRSLGSTQADRERTEDVGATAGAITKAVVPDVVEQVAGPLVGAVTELARREGERRAASQGDGGLDLWTQILLGLGAAGAAFTAGKSGVRTLKRAVKNDAAA